eukprot:9477068-Pyramimonas_sp.AAC.1
MNALGSRFSDVLGVKAHVADSEGLSPEERFFKTGNDEAGRSAKLGAAAHPKSSPSQVDKLQLQLKVSRMVSRLAAKVLVSWPRLDLSDVPFIAPPRPPRPGTEAPVG